MPACKNCTVPDTGTTPPATVTVPGVPDIRAEVTAVLQVSSLNTAYVTEPPAPAVAPDNVALSCTESPNTTGPAGTNNVAIDGDSFVWLVYVQSVVPALTAVIVTVVPVTVAVSGTGIGQRCWW